MTRPALLLLLGASCVVLGLASCGTALPDPQLSDMRTLGADLSWANLQDLRDGRRLYVDHCGGCHRLSPPQELTSPEWDKAFRAMRKRVRLDDAEADRVMAYLSAFARRAIPPDSTR
jgi:mono/diheme cytochrome c family protein